MPNTPTRLYGPAAPGTSTGELYAVPASTTDVISSIVLANTTVTAATITIGIGGTAAGNLIVPTIEVPARTLITIPDVVAVLFAAEALHGLQGTSAAITVTINGVRRT